MASIRANIISLLFILIISIFVSIPLLKPGLYQIHDDQQIARLFLYDQALKNGQFPVRWVDELGFGFGYPLFVFYPPLVYMVGEAFHLLSFSFVDSIKMVFFLSILLSGISMYLFAKELMGRLGALTAGLFYMFTPYRAIDVYIRGALSEAFSFVWLPLILLCFYKLKTPSRCRIALCGLTIGGLMITHNLVFMAFMLVLVPYIFYLWLSSNHKKRFLSATAIAFIVGAGISAFFWLPALVEKKFTLVDQILLVDLANFRIHFVNLQQLWNWPWGFGGSAAGLNDGLSFKIGKLNVILAFIVLIWSITSQVKMQSNKAPTLFFSLFIFSAFMTTSYSQFIWELITPLSYLQFPWRFLIMTTLFTSILAGFFIKKLNLPIFKIIAFFVLVSMLLFTNVKLFKPQTYRYDLSDKTATDTSTINWDVSLASFEYAPKGVELLKNNLGVNQINIKNQDIPKEKIKIVNGEATVLELSNKPQIFQFRSSSEKGAEIMANIFNFPGWQVYVDGNKTAVTDNNKYKQLEFQVPSGDHDVTIKFENTPVIKIANLVTFLSLGFLIYLIFAKWPKTLF